MDDNSRIPILFSLESSADESRIRAAYEFINSIILSQGFDALLGHGSHNTKTSATLKTGLVAGGNRSLNNLNNNINYVYDNTNNIRHSIISHHQVPQQSVPGHSSASVRVSSLTGANTAASALNSSSVDSSEQHSLQSGQGHFTQTRKSRSKLSTTQLQFSPQLSPGRFIINSSPLIQNTNTQNQMNTFTSLETSNQKDLVVTDDVSLVMSATSSFPIAAIDNYILNTNLEMSSHPHLTQPKHINTSSNVRSFFSSLNERLETPISSKFHSHQQTIIPARKCCI